MAITITHPFVSAIADDAGAVAAGEVVPSNWNAAHTIAGGTTGSVPFIGASSVLSQDNANFFWDDTNFFMKIGHSGTTGAYYLNGVPAIYEVPFGGGNNWFEGNAGNFTLTGTGNFGTGDGVLASLTTGAGNLGIGGIDSSSPYLQSTAFNITTGGAAAIGNVAIGASALCQLKTGFGNVAIGARTLEATTLDQLNVAIGAQTLVKLGSAGAGSGGNNSNVAIGNAALTNLSTGANLIGIGVAPGGNLTSSSNGGDIFIGGSAGGNISSTSGFNTMVGSGAGFFITGGAGNTIIGRWLGASASLTNVIALAYGNNNLALDFGFTNSACWTFAAPPVVPSFVVGSLPTGVTGAMAQVTDGTAGLAWGATVTGGHTTKYLVWYNGTNWTVMGS